MKSILNGCGRCVCLSDCFAVAWDPVVEVKFATVQCLRRKSEIPMRLSLRGGSRDWRKNEKKVIFKRHGSTCSLVSRVRELQNQFLTMSWDSDSFSSMVTSFVPEGISLT